MSTSHRWLLLPLFVALIGSGCVRSWSQTAKPAGPTVATFESLSPAEAAKKINLVAGNVIIMKQSFSGVGVAFAEQMGLGPDVERKIVIKKFAPGFRADIEW